MRGLEQVPVRSRSAWTFRIIPAKIYKIWVERLHLHNCYVNPRLMNQPFLCRLGRLEEKVWPDQEAGRWMRMEMGAGTGTPFLTPSSAFTSSVGGEGTDLSIRTPVHSVLYLFNDADANVSDCTRFSPGHGFSHSELILLFLYYPVKENLPRMLQGKPILGLPAASCCLDTGPSLAWPEELRLLWKGIFTRSFRSGYESSTEAAENRDVPGGGGALF